MKRPWNLPDVPIYSLATCGNSRVNMNLCTYVTAVSMKPKRYMVAVFQDTFSLEQLNHDSSPVLQLLGKHHLPLVNVLGKKSGKNFNKEAYLARKDQLELWHRHTVLKNCSALLELKKVWAREAGDHTLFVFDVVRFTTNHSDVLTLNDLRKNKLVRI